MKKKPGSLLVAPGYNTYYLNFLAGSAQSLMSHDDPRCAWMKDQWQSQGPRVPVVSMDMEKQIVSKQFPNRKVYVCQDRRRQYVQFQEPSP